MKKNYVIRIDRGYFKGWNNTCIHFTDNPFEAFKLEKKYLYDFVNLLNRKFKYILTNKRVDIVCL